MQVFGLSSTEYIKIKGKFMTLRNSQFNVRDANSY